MYVLVRTYQNYVVNCTFLFKSLIITTKDSLLRAIIKKICHTFFRTEKMRYEE